MWVWHLKFYNNSLQDLHNILHQSNKSSLHAAARLIFRISSLIQVTYALILKLNNVLSRMFADKILF